MGTVLDFLKEYGRYSFREMAMTEVDSLALCQLSYLKFDGMVPGVKENGSSVTLKSLREHPDYEKLFADVRYEQENRALVEGMLAGKRFRNLKLNCYVNFIEKEWETQFSAITFILSDGTVYVAFRGTDETIVGWKEDLNMAFSKPLRSQQLAVEYMERAASYISGDFYAGGHSKGGNLAVYAAMNCSERTRGRLLRVYSNDGPGFRPEIREIGNFKEIEDRVCKFIPRSSLVGMILEEHGNYEIVDSKAIGMLQHNTYTWKIEDGSFVRVPNMTGAKILRDAALNEWILSLPQEEIHAFVDTLYEVVSASEAFSVFDFGADWKRCLQHVLKAAREVDDATRKTIQKMLRSLFEILLENVKQGSAKY